MCIRYTHLYESIYIYMYVEPAINQDPLVGRALLEVHMEVGPNYCSQNRGSWSRDLYHNLNQTLRTCMIMNSIK